MFTKLHTSVSSHYILYCRLNVYNLQFARPKSSPDMFVQVFICGDTHLGGSSSLCQAPSQTESSPQLREVRRKRRVVLQRCRGLGLYMVRGSATALFLRETHIDGASIRSGCGSQRELWSTLQLLHVRVYCFVCSLNDEAGVFLLFYYE